MIGGQALVHVKDLRRIALPPNVDPATTPDKLPGSITLRGTKWGSDATVVVTRVQGAALSPKKIAIIDKGNVWPEGVVVAGDLPATWELNR